MRTSSGRSNSIILSQSATQRRRRHAVESLTALFVLAVMLLLAGCSSSWRAPLENRSAGHVAHSQAGKPPAPGDTRYRVSPGDTLYAIAWRSNNDFRDIARWNGIKKPYTIYVGQVLRLTAPRATVKAPPQANPQPRRSSPATSKRQPEQVVRSTRTQPPPRQATPVRSKPDSQEAKPAATLPAKSVPRSSGPLRWQWPVNGKVVSTYKRGDALRKGIKVAGTEGDSIVAAEGGKVVYSGSGLIGYGRLIIVKHNDKYLSAYAHNRKLLVNQGQQVTKGQKIAELGTSNDGKPLLHFEIRRDGKPVNPLALLPRQ